MAKAHTTPQNSRVAIFAWTVAKNDSLAGLYPITEPIPFNSSLIRLESEGQTASTQSRINTDGLPAKPPRLRSARRLYTFTSARISTFSRVALAADGTISAI